MSNETGARLPLEKKQIAILFNEDGTVEFVYNEEDFPAESAVTTNFMVARTVYSFIDSDEAEDILHDHFQRLTKSLEQMAAATNGPDEALHAKEAADIVKGVIDKAAQ